ncbi:flagellar hook-associated protein FlgL [Dechloromonas denitrificans]|uniref:flagellar hook-associated protein FlgL n=1 Tax=Dechloromonas denitrificans TaxID=281362 RepID=UPI001CF94C74|nr:flagellar hook-associated protein FlgL [Dechloromonas denitrificans]UCV08980.1 flagellar hook-associated protein FlgL [Dechloromonas denitrificans]
MRIASTQYHATMGSALQTASVAVEKLMQQMASGQRLLLPSDEPVTSVRLARLAREEAGLDQYRSNISALKSRLQQNETYLDGMTQDMMQARELMVWAADGGNSSEDVNAMAGSLQSLRDSLFYSANSRDHEGRYLFSGTAVTTPTITYDATAALGARYSFTGNSGIQKVVVGNGVTQEANVVLPEMATLLNQLDQASAVLQVPGADVNTPAVHAVVAAGLDGLDAALNSVGSRIASLGGTQNILETMETNHANVSLSNKQALITLGQLDYGDAAVKLNAYTSALEATQKAYGKVSALSLFNVL